MSATKATTETDAIPASTTRDQPITNPDTVMSTIPMPLSLYIQHAYPLGTDTNDIDTSLEAMMRHVGLKAPKSGSPHGPDM